MENEANDELFLYDQDTNLKRKTDEVIEEDLKKTKFENSVQNGAQLEGNLISKI